jgi:membrane protein YqaA with SNARE-associated domain
MSRVLDWIRGFGVALGAPGIFLLSFLDSSFVPIPEGVDILVIVMSIRHPERMLLYASLATAGSVAGCYVLYALARRGGEAFLRKRFKAATVDRALARFQRFGLLAIAVPAILPPPTPFKLFILAAGVAQVRPHEFILAVALGRGIRFFGKGLLAVMYGEAALDYLSRNAGIVYMVLVGAIAIGVVIYLARRRRPAEGRG